MTNLDIGKLVVLTRTYPPFVKGNLGKEYIEKLDHEDSRILGQYIIDLKFKTIKFKSIPKDIQEKITSIKGLAGWLETI